MVYEYLILATNHKIINARRIFDHMAGIDGGTISANDQGFIKITSLPANWLTELEDKDIQALFGLMNGTAFSPERQGNGMWSQIGSIAGQLGVAALMAA